MVRDNSHTGAMIMKYSKRSLTRSIVVLCCCAAVTATLIAPPAAKAWYSGRSYRGGYRGGYGYGNARYLQSQSQAAAEEARRESAREKNREAIAKKKEAFQTDYLASQAAIREGSRAASRAPRDAFYRKPGFTTTTLPGAAVEVKVGDTTFHYFSGMFYRQLPSGYIVVPAPAGAVVDTVPEQIGAAVYNDSADTYGYYFGTFFVREGEKHKVVAPPAGTLVGYVPDGYTETEVDEGVNYTFGDITFEPAYLQDNVVYRVVKS
jgi:hypothetical protein